MTGKVYLEVPTEARKDFEKMNKNKIKIISRHKGAVAWIKSMGYDGEIIAQLEKIETGITYIGTLPLSMIEKILRADSEFILLSLPDIAFSKRGKELPPAEMEKAGATLHRVKEIVTEKVDG